MRTRAVAVLLLMTSASCGPKFDGSRLREVIRLKDTIPILASMQPGRSSTFSRWNLAGAVGGYECPTPYEDVKAFYLGQLATDWVFGSDVSLKEWGRDLGGRELIFCNRSDPKYSFVITFSWREIQGQQICNGCMVE